MRPPIMRVAMDDVDFLKQMSILLKQIDNDIIRIIIELAIDGVALFHMHNAFFIDRAFRFKAIFQSGVKIISAKVRRDMDATRAIAIGDVIGQNDQGCPFIKRVLHRDILKFLAMEGF